MDGLTDVQQLIDQARTVTHNHYVPTTYLHPQYLHKIDQVNDIENVVGSKG